MKKAFFCFVFNAICLHAGLGADWMNYIDDQKLISEITIPGTHNSCARYGGHIAQCQAMTLSEQLNSGVRFLDIRCKHDFNIYHGSEYQHISFHQVLQRTKEFLEKHPTECVIMCVQRECRFEIFSSCPHCFAKNFMSHYTNGEFENLWFKETYIPKLQEVRGRIVLLSRFGRYSQLNFGIDLTSWQHNSFFDAENNEGIKYTIQDCFSPAGCYDKLYKISLCLEEASERENSKRLYLNFVNMNVWMDALWEYIRIKGLSPRTTSQFINEWLKAQLEVNKKGHAGIVIVDFWTRDLFLPIISRNPCTST